MATHAEGYRQCLQVGRERERERERERQLTSLFLFQDVFRAAVIQLPETTHQTVCSGELWVSPQKGPNTLHYTEMDTSFLFTLLKIKVQN